MFYYLYTINNNKTNNIMNTEKIEEIYDKVIQPKIVQMAIDCTLPMDMTQLTFGYFEGNIENYIDENHFDTAVANAMNFLSYDDELDYDTILKNIIDSPLKDSDLVDDVEGVTMAQKFEFSFTIADFLDTIGYNSNKAVKISDKLYNTLSINDDVEVGEPLEDEIHQNEFVGRIDSFRNGNLVVVDSDGDYFEVSPKNTILQ